MKVYSRLPEIPFGKAKENCITPGCLVVEGGGFRGLYAAGALDALMQSDINLQTTVGVSAGAMFGVGYTSGQIGWAARFDLGFRDDPDYVGRGALLHEHAIMGFQYLYRELFKFYPVDIRRFRDPSRELVVVATNLNTGKPVYFLKNSYHNIFTATIASASVPYVSKPIMLDGDPYLDGACSENIPFAWAKMMGFGKILVVRTHSRAFRKETKPLTPLKRAIYWEYPKFQESLRRANEHFNEICQDIDEAEKTGSIYVLAPDEELKVAKFEDDLEKLGDVYFQGYHDTLKQADKIKAYMQE